VPQFSPEHASNSNSSILKSPKATSQVVVYDNKMSHLLGMGYQVRPRPMFCVTAQAEYLARQEKETARLQQEKVVY
jgi:hypothetical protein